MKYVLILSIFLYNSAFSQLKVVIRGYSEDNDLKSIGISPPTRDCIRGWVNIDEIFIDSTHHFEKAITITRPGLIYLKCSDYAETFVAPGDTINLYIKKLPSPESYFTGLMQTQRLYRATIKGNHSYNSFFSALENETGEMNDLPFLISDSSSDDAQRVMVRELYKRRINLLNSFVKQTPNLPSQFNDQAANDIKGQYFLKLIFLLHQNEKLSGDYLQDIEKEKFEWDEVRRSQYLLESAHSYYNSYMDNISGENYSANRLENKYNNIKRFVRNDTLKNYLLTELLVFFLDKEPDNYQLIFEDYKKTCTNKKQIDILSGMYQAYMAKDTLPNIQLSDKALGIPVSDVSGQTFALGTQLDKYKNKILLLDFWASWCGPCLAEIPYLKQLEKKYNAKIVFISLSEDKSKLSWSVAMRQNDLNGNQFLMEFGQRKALLQELNIKTIPRFVLMTSSGKVLNGNLPGLNETQRVSKIIDKALSKYNSEN